MNVFNDLLIRSIASNCLYEKYLLTYVTTKDDSMKVADFIQVSNPDLVAKTITEVDVLLCRLSQSVEKAIKT